MVQLPPPPQSPRGGANYEEANVKVGCINKHPGMDILLQPMLSFWTLAVAGRVL